MNPLYWLGPVPLKGYVGDAGLDLTVAGTWKLKRGRLERIRMVERVAVPHGCWGLILGRSSALMDGLVVLPSVIDAGWRGPLYAFVLPMTSRTVGDGVSIAQLLVVPIPDYSLIPVESLPPGTRGERGFGSTGNTLPPDEPA